MSQTLARRARPLALAIVVALGNAACDSGQKEMQGYISHFQRLEVERQKVVRRDGLLKTLHPGNLHVADVAWCGDGKALVSSGGTDMKVLVWAPQHGEKLHVLDRLSGSRALACSADGRLLASGNYDKVSDIVIRVWDLETPGTMRDVRGPFPMIDGRHANYLNFVGFSPDSRYMLAHFVNVKQGHSLVVYETKPWKEIQIFRFEGRLDTRPALSASAHLYAYGDLNRNIVILDWLNSKEKIRFQAEKLKPRAIAFGSNDKIIYVAGRRLYDGPHHGMPEHFIQVYELARGKLLQEIKTAHLYDINALSYSHAPRLLITASGDKTAEIRDANTGVLINTLGDTENQIYSIDVSRDGERLASAGGVVNIWSLKQH